MSRILQSPAPAWQPVPRFHDHQPQSALADDERIGDMPNAHGFVTMLAAYRATGGVERAADLAWLLDDRPGHMQGTLSQLIMSGEIFCFEWHETVWVPMFQFDLREMGVKSRPQEVRAVLGREMDRWGLAAWFAQRHPHLSGASPVDMLDVNLPAVLRVAQVDHNLARHD
jgi:hypothetical protein